MGESTFRFYEELNDFLSLPRRKREFSYRFRGHPSIKDTIEAIGVPHTEVDLILIDGTSVGFSRQLWGGERVSVYPVFEAVDIGGVTKLRPEPLRRPAFVLDVHVGKLAAYLRLLGFDSLYRNDYEDPEIVRISLEEHRIILTRDIGLLKNRVVTHGYWLRSQRPIEQLREVIGRFDLERSIRPFTRCPVCNAPLARVEKEAVEELLPEKTRLLYEEFSRCTACGKIYWRGAHYEKLLALVQSARRR